MGKRFGALFDTRKGFVDPVVLLDYLTILFDEWIVSEEVTVVEDEYVMSQRPIAIRMICEDFAMPQGCSVAQYQWRGRVVASLFTMRSVWTNRCGFWVDTKFVGELLDTSEDEVEVGSRAVFEKLLGHAKVSGAAWGLLEKLRTDTGRRQNVSEINLGGPVTFVCDALVPDWSTFFSEADWQMPQAVNGGMLFVAQETGSASTLSLPPRCETPLPSHIRRRVLRQGRIDSYQTAEEYDAAWTRIVSDGKRPALSGVLIDGTERLTSAMESAGQWSPEKARATARALAKALGRIVQRNREPGMRWFIVFSNDSFDSVYVDMRYPVILSTVPIDPPEGVFVLTCPLTDRLSVEPECLLRYVGNAYYSGINIHEMTVAELWFLTVFGVPT